MTSKTVSDVLNVWENKLFDNSKCIVFLCYGPFRKIRLETPCFCAESNVRNACILRSSSKSSYPTAIQIYISGGYRLCEKRTLEMSLCWEIFLGLKLSSFGGFVHSFLDVLCEGRFALSSFSFHLRSMFPFLSKPSETIFHCLIVFTEEIRMLRKMLILCHLTLSLLVEILRFSEMLVIKRYVTFFVLGRVLLIRKVFFYGRKD